MLGFDEENARIHHEDMVDLCCPVLRFQRHIVQEQVWPVKATADSVRDQGFAGVVAQKLPPSGSEPPKEGQRKNQNEYPQPHGECDHTMLAFWKQAYCARNMRA